ncbi:DUF4974 domain-containing protein [Maribacter sp.]|nr:DUF4974 domain-containing protein [Maribacter sp.]
MDHFKISETELWEFISKKADASTIQKVEKWMESPDFDKALFNKISSIHNHTAVQEAPVELAKKRFFKTVRPEKVVWKDMLKYAAVITVIIMGTYFFNRVPSNEDQIVEQTTFGEQRSIALADGSKVWLNASSSVSYTSEEPRTLFLVGEAFFEVAKDTLNPFTVTTADLITVKALGTSFNIKAYEDSPITETLLLTGKVEVSSDTQFTESVILLPNEKLNFHRNTKEVLKSKIDATASSIAWKEGKIQFDNTSFQEIAIDLKAHFGKQIRFENENIAGTKFTGSFATTTPIAEIFEILKISKDFAYQLNTETNEWIIK